MLHGLDVGAIRIEGSMIRSGSAGFIEPLDAGVYVNGDSELSIRACIVEDSWISVVDGRGAGVYCNRAATVD